MVQMLIDMNKLVKELRELCRWHAENAGEFSILQRAIRIVYEQPTIDAVPLDGSFLKMSKVDYLIYNRHWLYEHFDQEMDIQRSAMKSMGYEPALKDAEPHWIPCSERLPETTDEVLTTYIVNGNKKRRFVQTSTWYGNEEEGYWSSPWDEYLVPNTKIEVLAWMPLPKPYEGDKE